MPRKEYRLRGQFASRETFVVPEDLAAPRTERAPTWPRWYSLATFFIVSNATLFAMCATGRPGA
jgi:hypothetical protein